MKRIGVALVVAAVACGGRGPRGPGGGHAIRSPTTQAERMIALFPEGAQLLLEIDLARLRANPVVGDVVTRGLARLGEDTKLPGLPLDVQGSPLASAEYVVLAAYGVGTANAASITVLATKAEVTGGVRVGDGLVALGPPEWTAQLEARAGIAQHTAIAPSLALMALRDHAMPAKAPGAVFRLTAQLPFDARVALAHQTGLPTAPAQLSIWADVVDDFAIIIDADAVDPGDKRAKDAAARMQSALATLLASAAREPVLSSLGLTSALRDVRTITGRSGPEAGASGSMTRGRTWVRMIITVGPRQLQRAAERARAMLGPAS
jgi:hypothetical protein